MTRDRTVTPLPPATRLVLIALAVLVALALAFLFFRRSAPETHPVGVSFYYEGPMYNKKGELMDDKGRVIDRLPQRQPTRAGR